MNTILSIVDSALDDNAILHMKGHAIEVGIRNAPGEGRGIPHVAVGGYVHRSSTRIACYAITHGRRREHRNGNNAALFVR
ncbi:hypothetical protein [Devosia epidermidihirudinis]|uniref:hypothetical protein n=1 Tax=Devosia epidermidihirudinis TaxID=1293439 RepID=UPI0018D21715|nr:hypothetical protein [Devosia epidermidihirudinis]